MLEGTKNVFLAAELYASMLDAMQSGERAVALWAPYEHLLMEWARRILPSSDEVLRSRKEWEFREISSAVELPLFMARACTSAEAAESALTYLLRPTGWWPRDAEVWKEAIDVIVRGFPAAARIVFRDVIRSGDAAHRREFFSEDLRLLPNVELEALLVSGELRWGKAYLFER
jgi:hypothetical protein